MMTMIEIDTDVPMPTQRASRRVRYPLRELEIGQSFFAPGKSRASVGAVISTLAPKRFVTQIRVEDGVKGIRVWRAE